MIIAEVKVTNTTCKTTPLVPIPKGIVGATVSIEYTDSAWDGLQKTVVFRSAVTKDVLNAGSEVTIPAEVVSRAGIYLYMGVYGVDAANNVVVPTIWTELGLVHGAAAPSGDASSDPSLPVWAQIQGMIGNLDDLDTDAKSNLVAAVNEALTRGSGEVDPAEVQKVVDEYLTANPPQAGSDGKDGITPTIGENGNWFLGSEDTGKPSRGAAGAPGAAGTPGKDGTDGKDGAPGKDGVDGHTPAITAEKSGKVTTIKADGTTIATISDGTDGTNGADGAPGKDGAAGSPGITPHIGANGNWYLGETDTGKPSRGTTGANGKDGAKGDDGADGKSAYQYAQDGGYTGTETDFMAKLAQEILSGTTDDLTPAQVYAAVSAGRPVKVQYTSSSYGVMSFTAFSTSETMGVIASQNIVYYDNVYMLAELGGYIQSGQWFFNSTVLAEKKDIPTVPSSLKNPNALTIKIGSTTVTYDGSTAQTVTIADGTEVSY